MRWIELLWEEKLGQEFPAFVLFLLSNDISTHFAEHLPYYVTSWEMQLKVLGRNMAFKCFQDYGFQWFPYIDLQTSRGNSANLIKHNFKNLWLQHLSYSNYVFSLIHNTKARYLLLAQREEEEKYLNLLHKIKRLGVKRYSPWVKMVILWGL